MGFVLLEKEITVFDEANVILESGELPPITTEDCWNVFHLTSDECCKNS